MKDEQPTGPTERVKVPSIEQAAAAWARRRQQYPAEAGVLRTLSLRPPTLTALRRALAQLADTRGAERAVLDALVGKMDHIHDDVVAIRGKLGIWRAACGGPRPVPTRRATEKKRKHTPEARRKRR